MVYIVCALRDTVAEQFTCVTTEVSEAVAIRNFEVAIRTSRRAEKGDFYLCASDFNLVALGEFDSESGQFINYPSEKVLRRGGEVE